jgi:hypothetical protein
MRKRRTRAHRGARARPETQFTGDDAETQFGLGCSGEEMRLLADAVESVDLFALRRCLFCMSCHQTRTTTKAIKAEGHMASAIVPVTALILYI